MNKRQIWDFNPGTLIVQCSFHVLAHQYFYTHGIISQAPLMGESHKRAPCTFKTSKNNSQLCFNCVTEEKQLTSWLNAFKLNVVSRLTCSPKVTAANRTLLSSDPIACLTAFQSWVSSPHRNEMGNLQQVPFLNITCNIFF